MMDEMRFTNRMFMRQTCKLCSVMFIMDGFDTYTAFPADAIANVGNGGGWTGSDVNGALGNKTRFGTGHSLAAGGGSSTGAYLKKTGGTNEATWFAACAFLQTAALGAASNSFWVTFSDGATAQCSIVFRVDGTIVLTSGNALGTVLATWSGAFVANSYDQYQFRVVINNSIGEFHIRKNGATSDSFSATGLNTRGGTANNYANAVGVGNAAASVYLDDFVCWNGNAASTPNDWIGDVRIIQCAPNLDTAQKQFTPVNALGLQSGQTGTSSLVLPVANTLISQETWYANAGGTSSTATVEFSAGFTGHAKLALYLADGVSAAFDTESRPGTLISVSNEVTNPTTGVNTFTFATPFALMRGWPYRFCLIIDAACTLKAQNTFSTGAVSLSQSYGAGFPATLSGAVWTATNLNSFTAYTTVTLTNAGCVSDKQQDNISTYVADGTVSDFDLYGIIGLPYSPASIIGLNLRAFVFKSDAGGRGFKITAKSGATSFDTAEYLPLITGSPCLKFYPTDPDTGVAWVPSGIAALQLGGKTSS